MKKIYALSISFLAFMGVIFAQSQDSSIVVQETDMIEQNIDSLMTLWLVQKSIEMNKIEFRESDSIITNFPDSVYIQRLNDLHSFIPLTYNEKVRSFINMYAKRKSQVELMLGLSSYYFPMFEEILDAKQLPLELKYLAVIESALNPRAVSRVGATGLWQFMYGTARMYDLKINSYIDERRSPYKSSVAAAQYLSDLNDIYKDWILALAAYNCGPGNVNKAIRRSGGKRDFWEIYYYLPKETRGYVPAFVAAAYLMNFSAEHNITPAKIDIPLAIDTIMLNEKVHFEQIAQVLNVPIQMIRDLNPEYRRDIIPEDKNGMPLTLPQDIAFQFIDLQDSILAYKDSIYLNPKIVFEEAPKYSSNSYSGGRGNYSYSYTPPDVKGKTKVYYTVKSGDAISLVANWYGVKVNDIKYWNNLRSSRISVGQKLSIYVPNSKAAKYSSINKLNQEQKSKQYASSGTSSSGLSKQVPKDANYVYHTVRKGESLWVIAQKFPGVSDSDIMKLNGLTSHSVQKLQPGDVLKIKRK